MKEEKYIYKQEHEPIEGLGIAKYSEESDNAISYPRGKLDES